MVQSGLWYCGMQAEHFMQGKDLTVRIHVLMSVCSDLLEGLTSAREYEALQTHYERVISVGISWVMVGDPEAQPSWQKHLGNLDIQKLQEWLRYGMTRLRRMRS